MKRELIDRRAGAAARQRSSREASRKADSASGPAKDSSGIQALGWEEHQRLWVDTRTYAPCGTRSRRYGRCFAVHATEATLNSHLQLPGLVSMRPTDLNSANADYVDALYEQYVVDPASVDPEWVAFFRGFDFGLRRSEEEEEAAATPSVQTAKPSPAKAPEPPQVAAPEPPRPVAPEPPKVDKDPAPADGSERRRRVSLRWYTRTGTVAIPSPVSTLWVTARRVTPFSSCLSSA